MKRIALLLWLFPTLVFAAPKVSVMPFTGKKVQAARDQLVHALCDDVECVPQAKASRGGKPDYGKAKKLGLSHFVTGKLAGKKLELQVITGGKKVKLKKGYALTSAGKLTADSLRTATSDVRTAVGAAAVTRQEPAPVAKQEQPPVAQEPLAKNEEAPPEEPTRTAVEAESPKANPDFVYDNDPWKKLPPQLAVIQLGTDLGLRVFNYYQPRTEGLRSYRAWFIFSPRLHGELYPFARATTGMVTGLGLEADYAFAVGLLSSPTGGPNFPTRLSRFDLAARLRLQPFDGRSLWIIPFAGYRLHSFSTRAAPDGTHLGGLPNTDYSIIRYGAVVEQPLLNDKALVYGELSMLAIMGAGSMTDFFPRAGGLGFELSAGGAYTLAPQLQLRAGYTLTRYGLGFSPEPTDKWIADGAWDLYGNLTLALRYTY